MLLNISHDYHTKKAEVDAEVGKAFDLHQRKKFGGISLSNLHITAASIRIYNLLILDDQENSCTVELRPNGIIVTFRSNNDTYALVIPNYKLRIYKGKAEEYSFYRDQHFIKIRARAKEAEIHEFIKKIIRNKSDNAPTNVEDLL